MVAAKPGARADDGGIGKLLTKGLAHGVADGAVEGGDLVEQREFVVAQADIDLVFEGGAGDADQRCLPQQRHAQVHFLLDCRHVAAAVRFLEESLDAGLCIKDSAAAGFGGVRGENGGDVSTADDGGGVGWCDAFFLELGEGLAQGNRRLDGLVIQILYEVSDEREIAECAGHEVDLGDVEIAEDGDEIFRLGIAVRHVEGHAAGRFDELEDVFAFLLRDDPAEHPAEEADVFADLFWGGCAHGEEPFWA